MAVTKRLKSLDVLRGITIAGMLLVNNPGSWSHIYAPLEHAEWNGLTPTDLVFPFFMFIMGVSTYMSLRRYDFTLSRKLFRKILRRALVIFGIGIAIQLFARLCYWLADPEPTRTLADKLFTNIRTLGVMQRLALCYFCAALLSCTVKVKRLPWVAGLLLVGYGVALLAGHGYDIDIDTIHHNIIWRVDSAVLGENHMYHGLGALADLPKELHAFDPEGLFSTLGALAHVLIGVVTGALIMKNNDNDRRVNQLFIAGSLMMIAGWLLSYGLPINKNIWSPTFVLTTCGMASTLLALLIWSIDIKGRDGWCAPFHVFGINPLFLYVLGGVLAILFGAIELPIGGEMISIHNIIYREMLLAFLPAGSEKFASCLFAIIFVAINWAFGYWLYKKKIYIKI